MEKETEKGKENNESENEYENEGTLNCLAFEDDEFICEPHHNMFNRDFYAVENEKEKKKNENENENEKESQKTLDFLAFEGDESVCVFSELLTKIGNAANEDSTTSRSLLLEQVCGETSSAAQQQGIGHALCVNEITNAPLDIGRWDNATSASQLNSTSFEQSPCFNYGSGSGIAEFAPRDSFTQAPLLCNCHLHSGKLASASNNEVVYSNSVLNGGTNEGFSSVLEFNHALERVYFHGHASDHSFHDFEGDGITNAVAALPVDVFYQKINVSASLVIISEKGIKLENLTSSVDQETFSFETRIDDIIDIKYQWLQRIGKVVVNLRVLSNHVLQDDDGCATSGIEELKFSVFEPNWPEKLAKITSLNTKYMELWNEHDFDESGLACGEIYEPQSAAWYQSSFQPLTITESNKPRNTIELILAQSYRSVDHQQQSLAEFPDQKVITRSLPAQSYQQFGQPSHLGEFSESGMTVGSLYCGQPTSYYPHHHFDCTTYCTQQQQQGQLPYMTEAISEDYGHLTYQVNNFQSNMVQDSVGIIQHPFEEDEYEDEEDGKYEDDGEEEGERKNGSTTATTDLIENRLYQDSKCDNDAGTVQKNDDVPVVIEEVNAEMELHDDEQVIKRPRTTVEDTRKSGGRLSCSSGMSV